MISESVVEVLVSRIDCAISVSETDEISIAFCFVGSVDFAAGGLPFFFSFTRTLEVLLLLSLLDDIFAAVFFSRVETRRA